MKKIICYGDSNTFGFNPKDGSRFDENTRWTALLQKNLGKNYEVINEGMCDRTGFLDHINGVLFSAQKHFPKILPDINFTDILILAIGTNDLQFQYNLTFDIVENGLKNIINKAKEKTKQIIIIPPVILSEKILDGYFKIQFDEKSIEKSKEIQKIYIKTASECNCYYFDLNEFVKPSIFDGLHYDENSHKTISDKLTYFIKNL